MKVEHLHSLGRWIKIKGTLFLACLRILCREGKGKREGVKEGGREGGRRKGRRGRDVASCQQLIYSYSLNWFLSKTSCRGCGVFGFTSKEKCYFKYAKLLESGMRINLAPNKCSPGLTPPFLHTVSDQKLDGEKASPSASWVGLGIRLGRVMLLQQNHNGRASCLELLHLNTS